MFFNVSFFGIKKQLRLHWAKVGPCCLRVGDVLIFILVGEGKIEHQICLVSGFEHNRQFLFKCHNSCLW